MCAGGKKRTKKTNARKVPSVEITTAAPSQTQTQHRHNTDTTQTQHRHRHTHNVHTIHILRTHMNKLADVLHTEPYHQRQTGMRLASQPASALERKNAPVRKRLGAAGPAASMRGAAGAGCTLWLEKRCACPAIQEQHRRRGCLRARGRCHQARRFQSSAHSHGEGKSRGA